jgi:drug/metabolite transporter (DMT)-like permease
MATPSYDAAGFTIVGLALGSALCNAIAMTANRGLVTVHHQLSPMYFFWVVEYFVAAALCVPFLLVPGAWGMVTPQAVGWVALLGLGVTAFPAIVLNTWPRPFRAAVFVLARAAEPFLAVAAAAAFLGERPPLVALAGGAVILVSVLATVGIHMVGPSRVFRPIRWN